MRRLDLGRCFIHCGKAPFLYNRWWPSFKKAPYGFTVFWRYYAFGLSSLGQKKVDELKDYRQLFNLLAWGKPVWPNGFSQNVAYVSFAIHTQREKIKELDDFVKDFLNLGEAIYHDEDTGETHCYFCDQTMGGEEKDGDIEHLDTCLYKRAAALHPELNKTYFQGTGK